MIARIWHGWTSHAHADEYEKRLREIIMPGIANRGITGYQGVEILRRELHDEVEFITIMRFDSLENIKDFVGEDYEVANLPKIALAVLKRYDERSQHYEIKEVTRT